ncbi:transposase family protein [Virgibacillus byunsanensis]|uniref:Transposase family protein n=1 Tax=Virgibacillus byunsanensis TaxID=570945 RepID=A0ABW3LHC1_9BACI
MELVKTSHNCPECHTVTNRVHDYQVQKIQHNPIFRKISFVYRIRTMSVLHVTNDFMKIMML